MTKNTKFPHPSKHQTTIDESLKKPIEVGLIIAIKIVEAEKVIEDEESHKNGKGEGQQKYFFKRESWKPPRR